MLDLGFCSGELAREVAGCGPQTCYRAPQRGQPAAALPCDLGGPGTDHGRQLDAPLLVKLGGRGCHWSYHYRGLDRSSAPSAGVPGSPPRPLLPESQEGGAACEVIR